MKLYLIRHGQTDNNVKKLFSGWYPAQLTDEGREQARMVGRRLQGFSFDRVFASDLDRAVETAGLVFPECEITPTSDLREIHVGSLGGRPYAEGDALLHHSGDFTPFGGEDRPQFLARIACFLDMAKDLPCERVGVVTHGAWICNVPDVIGGGFISTRHTICENCSVSVLEYVPDHGWRILKWNDTGELP